MLSSCCHATCKFWGSLKAWLCSNCDMETEPISEEPKPVKGKKNRSNK